MDRTLNDRQRITIETKFREATRKGTKGQCDFGNVGVMQVYQSLEYLDRFLRSIARFQKISKSGKEVREVTKGGTKPRMVSI